MTEADLTDPQDDFLAHDPVPLRPVAAETVAEWEPGTFIENLAPGPDGSWLVTIPSHNRVDRVGASGRHDVFAELANTPTGIVTDGTEALVLTGDIGQYNWQLIRVGQDGPRPVCDLPDLIFGNGMERAGDQLFAVDSGLGLVVGIDPRQGSSSVWLRHQLLTRPSPEVWLPGANGVAAHAGWLYVSNTGRAVLTRCPLGGADQPTELEIVAERLVADDFAVHPDGRIFLATHYRNSILRLDPNGDRTDIAGRDQGIAGSTSVAVDPLDPNVLYVTTTGGMNGLHDRDADPARLVRLRLTPG